MKLNIPDGLKLIGNNIVPKDVNVYYPNAPTAGQSIGNNAWSQMYLNWDWEGWIKPQIDSTTGNGVGCNVIRMIGGNYGIAAGVYTQDYYDACVLQVANYCNSIGVYFYAVGGGMGDYANTAISDSAMATIFATTFLKLQSIGNCIGIDLIQEANVLGTPTNASIINMISLIKAAGVTVPITCSTYEIINSSTGATWINSMAQHFDFLDFHVYYYGPSVNMDMFNYFRTNFSDKDIIVGEFGRPAGGYLTASPDNASADLNSVLKVVNKGDPRIRGAVLWAITDQDNPTTVAGTWPNLTQGIANMYGMVDINFKPIQWKVNLLKRYTGGSVAKANRIY